MLENLPQEDKEKLILNQEALERVKQEQLQNQETSPEAIQKKIQEEIQKIEEYSERITDIPEYQEKQIASLGGNEQELADELANIDTEIKRTKSGFIERTKNYVIGLATMVASVGNVGASTKHKMNINPEINKNETIITNQYNIPVQGINTSESTRTKLTPKDKVNDLDLIKNQVEIQKSLQEKEKHTGVIHTYTNLTKAAISRFLQKSNLDITRNYISTGLKFEDHNDPFEIYFGDKHGSGLGDQFELSSLYLPLEVNGSDNPHLELGIYNRGDYLGEKVELKRTLINSFDDNFFGNLAVFDLDKNDNIGFYLGLDKSGKFISGSAKDILDNAMNVDKIARFSITKNITEIDFDKGSFMSTSHLEDQEGNSIPLNIRDASKKANRFGGIGGGSLLILSPDHKTSALISGSIKDIQDGFIFFKKKFNLESVDIVKLDNGSFSNPLQTKEGVVTAEELEAYKMRNTSGSHNIFLKKLK